MLKTIHLKGRKLVWVNQIFRNPVQLQSTNVHMAEPHKINRLKVHHMEEHSKNGAFIVIYTPTFTCDHLEKFHAPFLNENYLLSFNI